MKCDTWKGTCVKKAEQEIEQFQYLPGKNRDFKLNWHACYAIISILLALSCKLYAQIKYSL